MSSRKAKSIQDAVYGCLVGGAIGDALGAPIETMWWSEIREQYPERLSELVVSRRDNTGNNYASTRYGATAALTPGPAGLVTDDTTMRHHVCLAIVRRGGRINPDDLAGVLIEKLNPNRVWINERIILDKLRIGMSPWESGRGTPPTGCASMCIAPIGIINAGDPVQAYQDGFNVALINQDNENRDGAATLAAAVAAAFHPRATVDSVIIAMMNNSSFVIRRVLEIAMDMARSSRSVDDFAEHFYASLLDRTFPLAPGRWDKSKPFSASSIEIVPIVAGLLHLCDGEPNKSIVEAANFGRDCDTTASIIGNITGAMHGASSLRADWIATVEEANAPFFAEFEGDPGANFESMASKLVGALHSQKAKTEAETARLGAILGMTSHG